MRCVMLAGAEDKGVGHTMSGWQGQRTAVWTALCRLMRAVLYQAGGGRGQGMDHAVSGSQGQRTGVWAVLCQACGSRGQGLRLLCQACHLRHPITL